MLNFSSENLKPFKKLYSVNSTTKTMNTETLTTKPKVSISPQIRQFPLQKPPLTLPQKGQMCSIKTLQSTG